MPSGSLHNDEELAMTNAIRGIKQGKEDRKLGVSYFNWMARESLSVEAMFDQRPEEVKE